MIKLQISFLDNKEDIKPIVKTRSFFGLKLRIAFLKATKDQPSKNDVSDILSQDTVSSNTQPPAISAPDGSGKDATDSDVDTITTSNATTADTTKAVCEELLEEPTEPWLSRKPSSTS